MRFLATAVLCMNRCDSFPPEVRRVIYLRDYNNVITQPRWGWLQAHSATAQGLDLPGLDESDERLEVGAVPAGGVGFLRRVKEGLRSY